MNSFQEIMQLVYAAVEKAVNIVREFAHMTRKAFYSDEVVLAKDVKYQERLRW